MDDNTYWLSIWRLAAAVAATIALTIGGCTSHRQYRIAEAIKAGHDPQAVRCAVEAEAGNTLACVLLITERK